MDPDLTWEQQPYAAPTKAFRSYLGKGRMEVFNTELWAIWFALQRNYKERGGTADTRGTKTTIFTDS